MVEFKPPIEFEPGSEHDDHEAVTVIEAEAKIAEAAQPFNAAVSGVQPVAVSGGQPVAVSGRVADVSGVRPLSADASECGAGLPGGQPASVSEGASAVSGTQPAGASEGAGAVSGVRSADVGGRVVAVAGIPALDVAVPVPAFVPMAPTVGPAFVPVALTVGPAFVPVAPTVAPAFVPVAPTVEYAPVAASSGGSVSVSFVPPGAAWPGFLTAPPGESAGGERED
ncbi:hypothetical protein ACQP1P_39230 [Dactylosporangium sp. CA-052675]|uniref:hypothetical protein n=1 Tax=Dactylosporangium sp. CA-052675 TaxID=3239927 RepID=UPI003D9477D7